MRLILHNKFCYTRDEARLPYGRLSKLVAMAQQKDVMRFLGGLRSLRLVKDFDKWHAHFDKSGIDEIVIQEKVLSKPFDEQSQILMHEIGHRGQFKFPEIYREYLREKLGTKENFLAMTNKVHLEDYRKYGISHQEMVEEAFAESYSRFALKRPMPPTLRQFWERAAT